MLSTEKPTRRRRWLLRVIVFAAALFVLYVILVAYPDWRARREWVEACAEADRLDPGWRLRDLAAASQSLPIDRDSVQHLTRAGRSGFFWFGRYGNMRTCREFEETPPQYRLSDSVIADLRGLFQSDPSHIESAMRVADCPIGQIPMPGRATLTANPIDANMFLDLIKRTYWPNIALKMQDGDSASATKCARAMVYAARPLSESHVVQHALLAGAIRSWAAAGVERILAQGGAPPAELDRLRQVMESDLQRPSFQAALRGERALIDDIVTSLDDGRLKYEEVANSKLFNEPPGRTGWTWFDQNLNRLGGGNVSRVNAVAALRHRTWLIERLRESPDGLMAADAEWTALRAKLPAGLQTQMTAYAGFISDVRNADARFRCAVAVLAAERFRQDKGHWPESLAELVPTYLVAVPTDPFVLKPVRIAKLSDGIAVYSLGPDGVDDGGLVQSAKATKSRDVGIRLWDVKKRSQPAIPLKTGRK